MRLWVDGQLPIDKWVPTGATTWSGSIALTASAPVELIMKCFEETGNASVALALAWESVSIESNTIPQSAYCAADPNTAIPPNIGLNSPANNATAILTDPVTLTATVTKQSAAVNSVKFYNNLTNLLATVPAPGPHRAGSEDPARRV